ncbi:MAG: glycosyltransferase [Pseudomonadota bacterium]
MNSQNDTGRYHAAQVRLQLASLCQNGDWFGAYIRLVESGFSPSDQPGLWEYLARQTHQSGQEELSHVLRQALWNAGVRSVETTLGEARHALQIEDPDRAIDIITSVFGDRPTEPDARFLLASALVDIRPEQALELIADADGNSADISVLHIDLLRQLGQFRDARAEAEAGRARHPNDLRFAVRLARVRESLNDWKAALATWADVAARDGGRGRYQSLLNMVRLNLRLEQTDAARDAAARHLLAPTPFAERLAVAQMTGQEALFLTMIDRAARGLSAQQVPATEWERCARLLMDAGRIGVLAWLWRRDMPLGETAGALLAIAPFDDAAHATFSGDIRSADAIRSPDFLLPLPPGPEGDAPLDILSGGRVLVVNASLNAGGAERQLVMLVQSLLNAGLPKDRLAVGLYSTAEDRGHAHFLPDLTAAGVAIHMLDRLTPDQAQRLPKSGRDMLAVLPAPFRADTLALWKLVRDWRPSVLHGWQDRSALSCGIVTTLEPVDRLVMSARNMAMDRRADSGAAISATLYRALCNRANARLTANADAGARDYEGWLGLRPGSVPVLANAVDTSRFRLLAQPRAVGTDPIRIGGVFRFAANKRPMLWLHTLAELRRIAPFRFTASLSGTGPFLNEMLENLGPLGLDDLLVRESVSNPDDLYGGSDLLLLMSRVEGTPNVLIEAQACGLAVAACDVGGVRDAMLRDGMAGGLLMDADVTAIAAAQALATWIPGAVAADPATRRQFVETRYGMGALGRAVIDVYNTPRVPS